MKFRSKWSRAGLVSVCFVLVTISAVVWGGSGKDHSAVQPAHRHSWWTIRHMAVNERVKQGNVDLIFIGDSITHGWEGAGKEVWGKYYGKRNAVNMGFGGDRTQHVLWRLDNGNIEGISPKAAVIMIGTNNSNGNDNSPEEIADGMIAICKKLRERLPKTKILLLAVFPRGEKPNPQREKIAKANDIVSKFADGKMIHYLDIGEKFLEADKSLSKEIMPDFLHLTPKGYQIWAEAIEAKLAELMGEKKQG
jgi:lysophospholipase L1-like esterase